jgi:hypothetical protein
MVIRRIIFIALLPLYLYSVDFSFEIVRAKYTSTSEENLSRADMYGIRNNFFFSKEWAVGLNYDVVDHKKVRNLNRYSLNLRYQRKDIDSAFEPYFGLGFGKEGGLRSDNFKEAILGAKYFLSDEFSVLFDTTYIKKSQKSKSYFLSFGLGYDFFRKPSAGRYTQNPLDGATLKSLAKHKVDTKEDIFLYPY